MGRVVSWEWISARRIVRRARVPIQNSAGHLILLLLLFILNLPILRFLISGLQGTKNGFWHFNSYKHFLSLQKKRATVLTFQNPKVKTCNWEFFLTLKNSLKFVEASPSCIYCFKFHSVRGIYIYTSLSRRHTCQSFCILYFISLIYSSPTNYEQMKSIQVNLSFVYLMKDYGTLRKEYKFTSLMVVTCSYCHFDKIKFQTCFQEEMGQEFFHGRDRLHGRSLLR